jgi:hypothetical protein
MHVQNLSGGISVETPKFHVRSSLAGMLRFAQHDSQKITQVFIAKPVSSIGTSQYRAPLALNGSGRQ